MTENKNLVIIDNSDIQNMIYTFRGKQVMLDRDLVSLYQVQTKKLNEQVKRNLGRFPAEFCFKLSDKEKDELVANCDRFKTLKHSSSNSYAFTEQGIAMLSAVLKSNIAVEVSIKIMNSFVEMRKFLLSNKDKCDEDNEGKCIKIVLFNVAPFGTFRTKIRKEKELVLWIS